MAGNLPDASWQQIADSAGSDATICLYGCSVGADQQFLQDLANQGNVTVVAWTGTVTVTGFGIFGMYFVTYTPNGKKKIVQPQPPNDPDGSGTGAGDSCENEDESSNEESDCD